MKYFSLQVKRLLRILPFTVFISAVLLYIAVTVFSLFSFMIKSENETRFKVDVVSNTKSRLFNTGIAALKTLDSSNISIDVELTDEETAKKHLMDGYSSAYVVVPKGFAKAAREGRMLPVSYYTTTSTVDISALVRDDITEVVSVLLRESQKGVFAKEALLYDNGYGDIAKEEANKLDIEYIDFIIDRSKIYKTEITGVSYGLDLISHLFIGYTVIFLCVTVIPLVVLFVRRDNSMLKMLSSANKGSVYTVLCEFSALLLVFLVSLTVVVSGFYLLNRFAGLIKLPEISIDIRQIILAALPAAVCICAFAFFVFETAGNIVSAVTGFFFSAMGLCYITGCMYPLYALPLSLQKISAFTPTGAARAYISLSATGQSGFAALCTLTAYTVLFLSAAVLIRHRRLLKGEV